MRFIKLFLLSIIVIFIQNIAISQNSIKGTEVICPAGKHLTANYVAPSAKLLKEAYARSQSMTPTANIVVNYVGFEGFEEAKTAFQYAVDIWSVLLKSDMTIYVQANYAVLGAGVLGSAGATGYYRNFDGAQKTNTWYPVALAEKMSRSNLNQDGAPDINTSFNSVFDWYLGTDGVTGGRYDFATVVLHELAHGFGFIDIAVGPGDEDGTGSNLASGFPSIFTHFMQDGDNNLILPLPDNTTELGELIISDNLFINSPLATISNSGVFPKIYAPNPYNGGSSISHWDELTFNGTPDALITPQGAPGEVNHHPGEIALSFFADMGWVHTYLEHQAPRIINGFTDDILISLDLSSDTTMTSTNAELHYSYDNFDTKTVVTMVDNLNGNYTYGIPNPAIDATLQYYIVGFEDILGRSYSSPALAPAISHTTIVRNGTVLTAPFSLADGGDFETDQAGFYSIPFGGNVNIWERGTPSGTLATATSGSNVWKTDLDANLQRPKDSYASALISPSFDLKDEIAHYELKFNLRMDIPSNFLNVGLNVAYSIDGGNSFKMLGEVNDGQGTNWYNFQDSEFLFSVGGSGWLLNNSTANNALDVSYNLSSLAGNDNVIFALLAYVRRTEENETYSIDGILIDDFEITKSTPQAAYYISGSKINFPGSEVQFNFASSGADSYLWDFGDGSPTSDLRNPKHVYNAGGNYDINLSITYPGGNNAILVEKDVLVISNKGTSYSLAEGGDFESNFSNFLVDNVTGTKFEMGSSTIIGKNGTVSGENAWVTGLKDANYANQSDAFLYTPLFDLAFLGDYNLSFEANYAFEDGWDGFIVEYTTDSAENWTQLIPTVQDGWYDRIAVQDNTAEGWPLIPMFTGTTNGSFVTKSISLSSISGNSSVGFRFHFKSDFIETDVGLALDNFQLTAPTFGPTEANFSFSLDDGCVEETLTFVNESTGTITNAVWSFGENATPSTATGLGPHEVVFDLAGTYEVSLTLTDNANAEFSSSQSFVVGDPHMPSFTSESANGVIILTSTDADTYQWYKDGVSIDGATSQTYEASGNGFYQIEALINSCKGISESAGIITAINEVLRKSVGIFPNPVSNKINIEHEKDIIIQKVELLDLSGKTHSVYYNSDQIKIKKAEAGIYILLISTNKGLIDKRVIIE